jgi:hypothetical protein
VNYEHGNDDYISAKRGLSYWSVHLVYVAQLETRSDNREEHRGLASRQGRYV